MVNDLDKAWLAGLFDGEGSVVVWKITSSKGKPVNWYKYRLSIAMVDKPAIERCRAIAGKGTVRCTGTTKSGKPVWLWKVEGRQAAEVAGLLLPFLIVKREQANLLIKLSTTMNAYGDTRKPSDEVLAMRDGLCSQIKSLNY